MRRPRAIGFAEMAATISITLGRPIEFEPMEPTAWRAMVLTAGFPGFLADEMLAHFKYWQSGAAAAVNDSVERTTGHPPAEFAAVLGRLVKAQHLEALSGSSKEP